MKELIGRLLRNDSAINLALIYDLVRAISRIFAAADESLFINKSDKVVTRHSFVNRLQFDSIDRETQHERADVSSHSRVRAMILIIIKISWHAFNYFSYP